MPLPGPGRSHPVVLPLVAYVASRVLTTFAVSLAALAGHRSFEQVSTVWDGRWYEKILLSGYPTHVAHGDFYAHTGRQVQSAIAFFPLYPMLARVAEFVVPGRPVIAGVAVALMVGAAATVLVWHIALRLAGRRVADRAAILFCLSPGAFVLSLMYAEGLLVLLSAACLIALLDRRWLLAGVLAALASATRPNALALVAACAWAAGVAVVRRREWKALLAPALAPLGMAAFFAYLWVHTHEPLIWFRVESEGWGERFDFGVNNLKALWDFLTPPFSSPNIAVLGLSMLLTAALVVVLVKARLPGVLNVYALAGLGLVLGSHINARPRFIFVAFPLVIALAMRLRPGTFALVTGAFASSTVMLTVFYGLHRFNYYP